MKPPYAVSSLAKLVLLVLVKTADQVLQCLGQSMRQGNAG